MFLTRGTRAHRVHVVLERRCGAATGLVGIDAIGGNAGSRSTHVAGAAVIGGHKGNATTESCRTNKETQHSQLIDLKQQLRTKQTIGKPWNSGLGLGSAHRLRSQATHLRRASASKSSVSLLRFPHLIPVFPILYPLLYPETSSSHNSRCSLHDLNMVSSVTSRIEASLTAPNRPWNQVRILCLTSFIQYTKLPI